MWRIELFTENPWLGWRRRTNIVTRFSYWDGDAERLGMWEFLYYEARHFFVARATIGNKHFQNTIAIAVWTD